MNPADPATFEIVKNSLYKIAEDDVACRRKCRAKPSNRTT